MKDILKDITLEQAEKNKFLFLIGAGLDNGGATDDEKMKNGEKKIGERVDRLMGAANAFIEANNYQGKVSVNQAIMVQVVIDYFMDIVRLKSFAPVHRANEIKIYAYESAWLLRRKPLQILQETSEYCFANEEFVLSELCHFLQKEKDLPKGFVDSLKYHLIYRPCDAKTLELMLLGFKAGEQYA
ncbi:MAG: hypothetical protein LBJ11_04170 [Oscillospiraceae bacterium]|jgi:hypothetical protein|nr:hypothetical protein [Oscillospiraceae bacterium]